MNKSSNGRCPYMPVTTTQLIMLDDFVGRKAWETEEKVA